MTSNRLFFKVLKEDMRERIWMPVMSALASFLAFPMVCLIYSFNQNRYYGAASGAEREFLLRKIIGFFDSYCIVMGGILAVCGALTAALAGFGYLFRRSETDCRHSLPASRNIFFGACYLNGLLAWLLPLAAGILSLGVMQGGFEAEYLGRVNLGEIMGKVAGHLFVASVAFLLMYHLTLTAMMLCGNVLNTFVSMLIMGTGAVCVYGLWLSLCENYLDTYCGMGRGDGAGALYLSPLVSAVLLPVEELGDGGYSVYGNLLIALLLGLCAWLLYRRRPSELSEQGIGSRLVSGVFRCVVSAAAGVCGWIFFAVCTAGDLRWEIFGAVLAGVLSHGILSICFQRDFRAFFANRLQLAISVAFSVAVCLIFVCGLFGYDSYLPEREEVAGIGIFHYSLSNRRGTYYDNAAALDGMNFRDADAAYAFLERAVSRDRGSSGIRFAVKVTLKSGRSYYRYYRMEESDWDVLRPILTSEEYLKNAYLLGEETDARKARILFHRDGESIVERSLSEEEKRMLLSAYDTDVKENAEALFRGEGRVLSEGELYLTDENQLSGKYVLTVYDFMHNTVEAMERLGMGRYSAAPDCAGIQSLRVYLGVRVREDIAGEALAACARERFGTADGEKGDDRREAEPGEEGSGTQTAGEGAGPAASGREEEQTAELWWEPSILITDQDEIREILELCSYVRPNRGYFNSVVAEETDGERGFFYLMGRTLPEKYILRFGELAKER